MTRAPPAYRPRDAEVADGASPADPLAGPASPLAGLVVAPVQGRVAL